jgi:hypothetical protein
MTGRTEEMKGEDRPVERCARPFDWVAVLLFYGVPIGVLIAWGVSLLV